MFKKKIEKRLENIEKLINDLDVKITEETARRDKWERQKESYLFDEIDKNSKLQNEKTLLKDTLNVKEKIIEDLEKEIASKKEIIKSLTDEISKNVAYKNENESLNKEVKKLEKTIKAYEEKGIAIPKKVPGSTSPRKGQALKETIKPVKG